MRSCQKVLYLNSQYQRQGGQQGDISLEDDKPKTGEFSGLMGGAVYHLSLSRMRLPFRIWSGSPLLTHLYFSGCAPANKKVGKLKMWFSSKPFLVKRMSFRYPPPFLYYYVGRLWKYYYDGKFLAISCGKLVTDSFAK